MPTFSNLQNFIDTINTRLDKNRRGVNGSEGVTVADIKQSLIDAATFASELTINGTGKANLSGAIFTGGITVPTVAIGASTLSNGNIFQINFSSALAQKPYIGANASSENPYFELQRWSGASTNFNGSRIIQRNARLAFDIVATAAGIGSQTFTEVFCIDTTFRVGIGVTSPTRKLDVQDNLTSTTDFANIIARFASNGSGADTTIHFSDNIANNAYISMRGGALKFGTGGNNLRFNISSGGIAHFASRLHINTGSDLTDQTVPLYVSGNAQVVGAITLQKIIGGSSTPTITSGASAGTSPTIAISGKDTAGQITITTGTSPTAGGTIVTVTFNVAYSTAPFVALTPANANASALALASRPFPGATTTTFVLSAGSVALAASTQYIFNYHVIQ